MEGSDIRFNIKRKGHHYTVTDTHKGIKINMEGSDIRFNIKRKGHHYTVTDTHKGIEINMEGSDVRSNIKRKGHRYTSITPRRLYRDSLYIDTQKTKMNKM